MKTLTKIALACLAFSATATFANTGSDCDANVGVSGMHARMVHIAEQLDRLERSGDRVEQRQLMELNVKQVHEALRRLRSLELPVACQVEFMTPLLEALVRNQEFRLTSGSD